eukprot:TRINITY_DN2924_c1_g1_i1.p1 TRINITY_DN2924_c1_g1~~TRINITY_DN2924_c1_g1_i1.p1  ORF type:complete len:497 (+),score=150.36 TRINITY_DN2924_c1_g1_i1:782-2272(+)
MTKDQMPVDGQSSSDDKTNLLGGSDVQPYPGALYALLVLTGINLLNYMDRYIPSANKTLIQADLGLSDTETALPVTLFIVTYMIASPFFAWLADRGVSRRLLMSIGVIIWSIATAAGAFAYHFWSFLLFRCAVGVGEASYATIAPALLSDFYPPARRNRALMVFYIALPVGAAVGYGLGGVLGSMLGWRRAFLVCGFPGVLIAALVWLIKDPGRGTFDAKVPGSGAPVSWMQATRLLLRNRQYGFAVGGMIMITFATGGMADWLPAYLQRVGDIELAAASLIVGGATVLGGLSGTLLGSFIGERLKQVTRSPYFAVSSLAMVPASISMVLALIYARSQVAIGALVFAVQIFVWCYSGPMNALLANSVSHEIRTRAFAVQIFLIHVLGDAISPTIIGVISDQTGDLLKGISLVPLFTAMTAICWGVGWWLVDERSVAASRAASAGEGGQTAAPEFVVLEDDSSGTSPHVAGGAFSEPKRSQYETISGCDSPEKRRTL